MPLSSQSGYGPGSSYTNAGGADFGPASMAAALLAREGQYLGQRAAAPVRRAAPAPMRYASQPPPAPVGAGTTGSVGQSSQQDEYLKHLRGRDEILQMQARENPAPMRGLTGFNMIGSAGGQDVMDTNAMNSYQRAAYMPSGASFTPTSYTASRALSDDRTFDPYEGRRLDGPGVALGPGADFARRQLAAAAGR